MTDESPEKREPYRPPADHHWRDWDAAKRRYRAYNPQGVYVETVLLRPLDRKTYEVRGWTFTEAGYILPTQ